MFLKLLANAKNRREKLIADKETNHHKTIETIPSSIQHQSQIITSKANPSQRPSDQPSTCPQPTSLYSLPHSSQHASTTPAPSNSNSLASSSSSSFASRTTYSYSSSSSSSSSSVPPQSLPPQQQYSTSTSTSSYSATSLSKLVSQDKAAHGSAQGSARSTVRTLNPGHNQSGLHLNLGRDHHSHHEHSSSSGFDHIHDTRRDRDHVNNSNDLNKHDINQSIRKQIVVGNTHQNLRPIAFQSPGSSHVERSRVAPVVAVDSSSSPLSIIPSRSNSSYVSSSPIRQRYHSSHHSAVINNNPNNPNVPYPVRSPPHHHHPYTPSMSSMSSVSSSSSGYHHRSESQKVKSNPKHNPVNPVPIKRERPISPVSPVSQVGNPLYDNLAWITQQKEKNKRQRVSPIPQQKKGKNKSSRKGGGRGGGGRRKKKKIILALRINLELLSESMVCMYICIYIVSA